MHAAQLDPHIDDSVVRPVIAGTNIKVSQIANEVERLRMTPDEVLEAHPHLTLGQVHAALAYYRTHQAAIQRDWQETEALITALEKQYPNQVIGSRDSD